MMIILLLAASSSCSRYLTRRVLHLTRGISLKASHCRTRCTGISLATSSRSQHLTRRISLAATRSRHPSLTCSIRLRHSQHLAPTRHFSHRGSLHLDSCISETPTLAASHSQHPTSVIMISLRLPVASPTCWRADGRLGGTNKQEFANNLIPNKFNYICL